MQPPHGVAVSGRATHYDFHPIVDCFPPLGEDAMNDLVSDIQTNGLRIPIMLDSDGRIVDGKHRYLACHRLGVEVRTVKLHPDQSVVAFVVSANMHRRQMSTKERIAAAAACEPFCAAEAAARMRAGVPAHPGSAGKAAAHAASIFNVSQASVERAKAAKERPEKVCKKRKTYAKSAEKPRSSAQESGSPSNDARVAAPEHDPYGTELPARLVPVFAASELLADMRKRLAVIRGEIEEIGRQAVGVFLVGMGCDRTVKELERILKDAEPHAVCPVCSGVGCKDAESLCRRQGWVTKSRYKIGVESK